MKKILATFLPLFILTMSVRAQIILVSNSDNIISAFADADGSESPDLVNGGYLSQPESQETDSSTTVPYDAQAEAVYANSTVTATGTVNFSGGYTASELSGTDHESYAISPTTYGSGSVGIATEYDQYFKVGTTTSFTFSISGTNVTEIELVDRSTSQAWIIGSNETLGDSTSGTLFASDVYELAYSNGLNGIYGYMTIGVLNSDSQSASFDLSISDAPEPKPLALICMGFLLIAIVFRFFPLKPLYWNVRETRLKRSCHCGLPFLSNRQPSALREST